MGATGTSRLRSRCREGTPGAGCLGRVTSGGRWFAGREAGAKKPAGIARGAAEGCKANSGTLSILPSKFAPSTKDRLKEDRQETLASELRRPHLFPNRPCEFPASIETFPCAGLTNSLPRRRREFVAIL